MLLLKPNCELCDVDLPPSSEAARICSYECTFCASCVEEHLHNVCPNCGGGFYVRPIRSSNEHRTGVSLSNHPASAIRVHSNYSREEIHDFVEPRKDISPADR